jgi:hypothetical protein
MQAGRILEQIIAFGYLQALAARGCYRELSLWCG